MDGKDAATIPISQEQEMFDSSAMCTEALFLSVLRRDYSLAFSLTLSSQSAHLSYGSHEIMYVPQNTKVQCPRQLLPTLRPSLFLDVRGCFSLSSIYRLLSPDGRLKIENSYES